MENDYNIILEHAKEGTAVPDDVLKRIRAQLVSGRFDEDPYTLLHILGCARDEQSLPIVRRYVDFDTGNAESDAMLRRIALQVIGRMWQRSEAFELAIHKAFEDSSPDVRAVAATLIGFLGRRFPQLRTRSAQALLKGLSKKKELGDYTWESFYYGLLELLDVPPNEWPSPASTVTDAQVREDI